MDNSEQALLALQHLTLQISAFIFFGGLLIYTIYKSMVFLSIFLKKRILRKKIRNYDLNTYEIFFDNSGYPVTLLSKKENKIIFL